ncbi:aspartate/glutamate racemase family protein [Agaribacter flavus]|uniref:Aspartate/glutamate racemase family protein n=1 Tax=Agaribacter flavus TaxID=1902781 RepID=A0ABV7FIY4_9ALTE
MKTIGLLGGMSWESTLSYYKAINEEVKRRLGGLHSAKICLYSVDFAEIEQLQHKGQWMETAEILVNAAKSMERAGADFLLICTNTMHKVAPDIARGVSIPIIHIADVCAQVLLSQNITKVGLLGTRFTMEQNFYKGRLQEKYGIEVVVPNHEDSEIVHAVIYDELCKGVVSEDAKIEYLRIIDNLHKQGVQGVILGCTEIALLVKQQDTVVPLFDTTAIHAMSAVDKALENESF